MDLNQEERIRCAMNAEDVYKEIKAFLKYCDLHFSQMDMVEVTIPKENTIVLTYGRISTAIDFSDEH